MEKKIGDAVKAGAISKGYVQEAEIIPKIMVPCSFSGYTDNS